MSDEEQDVGEICGEDDEDSEDALPSTDPDVLRAEKTVAESRKRKTPATDDEEDDEDDDDDDDESEEVQVVPASSPAPAPSVAPARAASRVAVAPTAPVPAIASAQEPPTVEKPKKKGGRPKGRKNEKTLAKERLQATEKAVATAQGKTPSKKKNPHKPKNKDGSDSKKGPYFSEGEDIILCRAFTSCSCDPIAGTGKGQKAFWQGITARYNKLVDQMGDDNPGNVHIRDWERLRRRWKNNILPAMNTFIGYYRSAKHPPKTGRNENDYLEDAKEQFLNEQQTEFKFGHVVSYLSTMPKFDSSVSESKLQEIEKEVTTINNTAPMGATLARPIGSKAAKTAEERTVATERMENRRNITMDKIADSSYRLSSRMDLQRRVNTLLEKAKMYERRGKEDKVDEIYEEIEKLESEAAAAIKAADAAMEELAMRNSIYSVPTSVAVSRAATPTPSQQMPSHADILRQTVVQEKTIYTGADDSEEDDLPTLTGI